ncbi:hypothetical protein [Allosphingosinicella sp.]|uniref:hypothetical protein n=1 Tax=Allosphingosinicella sp. TaxID=2823234 RepID=UPI002EDC5DA8
MLDGKLQPKGFILTISAANLSLGNFIIFIAIWGYNFGATGLAVFLVNLLLNVVGFLLYLKVFRTYIEDRANSGTIHEYISTSYCRRGQERLCLIARLFASIVTVSGLALAILFELSLAVSLLQPRGILDSLYIFAGLAALIGLFTANGGFRTLFVSDGFNACLLGIGAVGLVILMWHYSHATGLAPYAEGVSFDGLRRIGLPAVISICVIGFGWMLVAMDQWQRACASRSYNTTWLGTSRYLIVVAAAAAVFATWGAFAANVLPTALPDATLSGGANPLADITLLAQSGSWGSVLALAAITGLVFAAVATTNTFLNVLSHSLTSDVLVGILARRGLHSFSPDTDRFLVSVARVLIVSVVALLIVLFAVFSNAGLMRDPLSFFFIAYSLQFALMGPMIVSAVPKGYRPGGWSVNASLVVGFLAAIFVGFGSWAHMQRQGADILGLPPVDWLTLAPVVTVFVGLLPLIIGGLMGHVWRKRTAARN